MRPIPTFARDEMLASPVAATPLARPPLELSRWFRRAAAVAGELLALMGIILCIPFAILALGVPIALLVRFLLWIGGAL